MVGAEQAISATLPMATTGSADVRDLGSVTLHGSLNPEGLPAHYHFEYEYTYKGGFFLRLETPDVAVAADAGDQQVSAEASNAVAEGQTYTYRLLVTNANGTVSGGDRSWTFPCCALPPGGGGPPPPLPPGGPTGPTGPSGPAHPAPIAPKKPTGSCVVPHTVGMEVKRAMRRLRHARCHVHLRRRHSKSRPVKIARSLPAAGTRTTRTVLLTVK